MDLEIVSGIQKLNQIIKPGLIGMEQALIQSDQAPLLRQGLSKKRISPMKMRKLP